MPSTAARKTSRHSPEAEPAVRLFPGETPELFAVSPDPEDPPFIESAGSAGPPAKRPPVFRGRRREMTKEQFERMCALQCRIREILGYTGGKEEQLEKWCRRVSGRTLTPAEVRNMVRMDGLIQIREASFELLKKSSTVVAQQFSRFLPDAGLEEDAEKNPALEAFVHLLDGIGEEDPEGKEAGEEERTE